jgi:hypothetical protein
VFRRLEEIGFEVVCGVEVVCHDHLLMMGWLVGTHYKLVMLASSWMPLPSSDATNRRPQHIGAERAIDVRGIKRVGILQKIRRSGWTRASARQSVHPSERRTITQKASLSNGGQIWRSGLSLVTLCEILIMAWFPSLAGRRRGASSPGAK